MNENMIDNVPESSKLLDERTTIRITFLRKLYGLLALQFIISLVILRFLMSEPDAHSWIQDHKYLALGLGIFHLVLTLIVYFKRSIFRRVPLNVIVYIIFTLLLAYDITFLSDKGNMTTIFVFSVIVLCVSLFFYALTARTDLTFVGGTIYIIGSALFTYFGLLVATDIAVFTLVLLALLIVIIGFYLIYDIKFLTIGQSLSAEMEDPFVGSIVIYLDTFLIVFRLIESLGKLFKGNRF